MVMVLAPSLPLSAPLITCIICGKPAKPDGVTSGSLYADDRQAFACNNHLHNRRQWVPAWAVFETEQQQLRKTSGEQQ